MGHATHYAEQQRDWDTTRWWVLESAALEPAPKAQRRYLLLSGQNTGQGIFHAKRRWIELTMFFLMFILPMLGTATLLGWFLGGQDGPMPLLTAGILIGTGTAAGIIARIKDLLNPEIEPQEGARAMAILTSHTLIAALFATIFYYSGAEVDNTNGMLGVFFGAGNSAYWIKTALQTRNAKTPPATNREFAFRYELGQNSIIHINEMEEDLKDAITILARKNLISTEEAHIALNIPLGDIALTLAGDPRQGTSVH